MPGRITTAQSRAVATDLTRVRVTALVDETLIDEVQVGQGVDIAVDAFPDVPLTGVVEDIRRSTADATRPLPPASGTGEFQKVTQVVPVRVASSTATSCRWYPA